MRFLFTMQAAFGHFHSMVPLAQALKDHGHEVAFATGKSFGPVLERTGFSHFPAGFDFDGSKDILVTLPGWKAIVAKYKESHLQQVCGFIEMLGPMMVDDLIALVESWRPDMIVRDQSEFAGYVAAEYYGLPHATVAWSLYIDAKAMCPREVNELRLRCGLRDDPGLDSLDRFLVFDFMPTEWTHSHMGYPSVTRRFCAKPFDMSSGDDVLPAWFTSLPYKKTVHATLGTTFNQAPITFRAILSAFASEEINLIVTVGTSMDPAQFGQQPEHIKIARYIPQTLLVPHCDALIFHGGYNTLQSALWHGLPTVILPQGAADNLPTGRRCAELGIGVLVEEDPPRPETIRAAVKEVLDQESYRIRAAQIQRSIKELPSLDEAVQRLESIAKTS